jgi:predicted nucleic-acid-binding protein
VRAVDTNILARFYLQDDAAQGRMAASVLAAGDVFVSKTVILELEWVLRYVAEQPESKVIECLAHLIMLPGITVEDRDEIEAALSHCRKGIDFADALHLAASKACSELLTFDDRGFARRARTLRLKPPVQMPNALILRKGK